MSFGELSHTIQKHTILCVDFIITQSHQLFHGSKATVPKEFEL